MAAAGLCFSPPFRASSCWSSCSLAHGPTLWAEVVPQRWEHGDTPQGELLPAWYKGWGCGDGISCWQTRREGGEGLLLVPWSWPWVLSTDPPHPPCAPLWGCHWWRTPPLPLPANGIRPFCMGARNVLTLALTYLSNVCFAHYSPC